jgi:ribose 5-phosphate isomerase A
MNDQIAARTAAARAAVAMVQDGMRLGLGSGSTFLLALEALAARIAKERLDVKGVPSSAGTASAARRLGVGLLSLPDVERLDLTIDGADEVDPQKNLIKGGGAALVREKIVAACSARMVVVVDEAKLVPVLGVKFRLPVEVMQFGWRQARAAVQRTGCMAEVRAAPGGAPVQTDNGNFLLDCSYPSGIADPARLHASLNQIPGVVDNGLFVGLASKVIVGRPDGTIRTIE